MEPVYVNPYKFDRSEVRDCLNIAMDHLVEHYDAAFQEVGLGDVCISFSALEVIEEQGFTRTWYRPVLVFNVILSSGTWRLACAYNGTKFAKTSGTPAPEEDKRAVEAFYLASDLRVTGRRADGIPVIRDGPQEVMARAGAMTSPCSVLPARTEDTWFFVSV